MSEEERKQSWERGREGGRERERERGRECERGSFTITYF
jgi:hypothetical protein